MRKIIWTFSLCLVVISLPAATLQGVGEVENCYMKPNKSIPTCDGSKYTSWDSKTNFCYIPSRGCNMPVVLEAVVSYDWDSQDWLTEYEVHENIEIITEEQWEVDGKPQAHTFCRMVYPYTGRWYIRVTFYNEQEPFMFGPYNCNLFVDAGSYNCFQEPDKEDDPCGDEYVGAMFPNEEEREINLPKVFEPVPETPCSIGISRLMVSTGDAFRLWAEKYTEPSLVVQYNDEKCYVKLETGAGKLNINYNGEIYHAVE